MGTRGQSGPADLKEKGVSRRNILAGLAAGVVLPVVATAPAHAAKPVKPTPPPLPPREKKVLSEGRGHGKGDLRGSDIAVKEGRSKQGRFGLMFPGLQGFAPDDVLLAGLAQQMIDRTPPHSDVKLSNDGFDNPDIPAGIAYLGQFIDHDMTLDLTPLSDQQADPTAIKNFDTPFFDLGAIYGRGPAQDPQLYDPADPRLMKIGRTAEGLDDLPRNADGTAIIGDHRNDENLIVAQLHLAFLKLHNGFVHAGNSFADAQRLTRWHFQWLIVNDFLRMIAGQDVIDSILTTRPGAPAKVECRFYKPGNKQRPMMPIEYSVAAYRFGHSMIRAEYEMTDGLTVPFFGGPRDLRGSRPLPLYAWADWNYFFDIPGLGTPDDRNMTRYIDTKLALPLSELPPTVVKHVDGAILNLAQRNLQRGKMLGLPAGQDVAKAMGVMPIANDRLGLTEPGWNGKAPLWFYILKESELLGGRRLGPVGGRIVAEVILGILALDKTSYLNAPKGWAPPAPYACGDFLLQAGVITVEGHPEQEGVEDEGEELEGEELEGEELETDELETDEADADEPAEVLG
ncbi:peroxidase family protein [Herbiconiux sp. SYSU D00978]|uniref:peroxidase family protein n=1 Tax=Herbiconiux sp. SYSU D00978 TaxID=2812562 RepID=UPI001A97C502|nr:heme peroxidase family protein [Herbiconiux sp. SYSU D00978]